MNILFLNKHRHFYSPQTDLHALSWVMNRSPWWRGWWSAILHSGRPFRKTTRSPTYGWTGTERRSMHAPQTQPLLETVAKWMMSCLLCFDKSSFWFMHYLNLRLLWILFYVKSLLYYHVRAYLDNFNNVDNDHSEQGNYIWSHYWFMIISILLVINF